MSDLDDRDGSEEKVSRVLAWLSALVTNKLLGQFEWLVKFRRSCCLNELHFSLILHVFA